MSLYFQSLCSSSSGNCLSGIRSSATSGRALLTILLAVLVLVVGGVVYYKLFSPSPEHSPESDPDALTEVGQVAPDFEVTTLDDAKIRLSDLRGKAILVGFFATWCPPCQKELPVLEKTIWSEFKNDGLVMLAVAREQTESEVRPFQTENSLTFTIATDPNRVAYSKYAAKGIPRVYLIAPDGTIAYQLAGYQEEEIPKIRETVRRLLNDGTKRL
jgi:peroxiredoxin